ncbi:MAG TPA: hypothetical protein VKW78_05925 [Terriglobales bacterium]|nr:hypothetical protein [Terriglobales bacterium]
MLSKVVDALFGCLHTNYSFPITTKPVRNNKGVPAKPRTYVVCLQCGKDLPYDWAQMKIVAEQKNAA